MSAQKYPESNIFPCKYSFHLAASAVILQSLHIGVLPKFQRRIKIRHIIYKHILAAALSKYKGPSLDRSQ